jgi:penicillin-binding protein 2
LASTTTRPPRTFLPRTRSVEEPYRLTPRLAMRLAILGVVTLALFAALFFRLWALQVLQGSQYRQSALNNQSRTVRLQAPRGLIVDRNNAPLVTNATATAIEIWPADLPKIYNDRYAELRRLARFSRVPLYEIAAAIKKHDGDMLTPVTIRTNVGDALVRYLAEHRNEFPGVQLTETWVRHYPYESLGAQLLGYVGEISPSQLKQRSRSDYVPGDEIGQSGLEGRYDTYLRGHAGMVQMRVDSLGHPRSALSHKRYAQQGRTLRLTLDLGLQRAAENALDFGIRLAQSDGHWAAQGGAIVALDPRNGEILAMASAPRYKPAVFTPPVRREGLADQGLLLKTAQRRNYPSINRAVQGMYPPGSTFKPITALAALQERLVTPYELLPCTGSYTSPQDRAHHKFKNWDPFVNEGMDMPTALAASCDTYFYELGNRFFVLPSDRKQPLQIWAKRFGFGGPTGVDLGPESSGLVPTIDWRHSRYTKRTDPCCWEVDRLWKPGDSIQLAIGQKDLLVTPLQMARFYALIANGGKLVTPHLRLDVENPNGTAVPMPGVPAPRPVVGLDPASLQVVRRGLFEATHVSFGTSSGIFGNFGVPVAGKTGTAEKFVTLPGYAGLQDQSWWCGYGPFDDPTLVVCAVIENGGHGGTAAAPAALKVFEQYFHVKAPTTGDIHSD